jgi:YVTN family beta-propeller protein
MGVAVDHIRNRIYVANAATGYINVIDGIDNKILMNSTYLGNPSDIAINPLTNLGYIIRTSEDGCSVITELDLSTNELNENDLDVCGSDFNTLAINTFANMLYVTDSNFNNVSIIDLSHNNNVLDGITVDSFPAIPAINQNKKIVYVSNFGSDTVSVIDGSNNRIAAEVIFNIQPANAGSIECVEDKDIQTNTYIRITLDTICKAKANNGFTFTSCTEKVSGNSSKTLTTIPNNLVDRIYTLISNDYATLSISKHGIFTANFREAPSPIPKEIWISLFGIMLGTIMPSIIRWLNGWKQRRRFYKYIQELHLNYAKLNQNDMDKEITEKYAKGKINEAQYKMLKEKISKYYKNTSK